MQALGNKAVLKCSNTFFFFSSLLHCLSSANTSDCSNSREGRAEGSTDQLSTTPFEKLTSELNCKQKTQLLFSECKKSDQYTLAI